MFHYQAGIHALQRSSIIKETAGTTWSILTHFFDNEMNLYAYVLAWSAFPTNLPVWVATRGRFSPSLLSASESAKKGRRHGSPLAGGCMFISFAWYLTQKDAWEVWGLVDSMEVCLALLTLRDPSRLCAHTHTLGSEGDCCWCLKAYTHQYVDTRPYIHSHTHININVCLYILLPVRAHTLYFSGYTAVRLP